MVFSYHLLVQLPVLVGRYRTLAWFRWAAQMDTDMKGNDMQITEGLMVKKVTDTAKY